MVGVDVGVVSVDIWRADRPIQLATDDGGGRVHLARALEADETDARAGLRAMVLLAAGVSSGGTGSSRCNGQLQVVVLFVLLLPSTCAGHSNNRAVIFFRPLGFPSQSCNALPLPSG